jgi:hypothetical protein
MFALFWMVLGGDGNSALPLFTEPLSVPALPRCRLAQLVPAWASNGMSWRVVDVRSRTPAKILSSLKEHDARTPVGVNDLGTTARIGVGVWGKNQHCKTDIACP